MTSPVTADYTYFNSVTDYLEKSFAGQMVRYAPNGQAPIFAMTSALGDGTALVVEHSYFAKTMVFPSFTLGAAVANGTDTTFTGVANSTVNLAPGDLLRSNAASAEVVRVVSVVSSNTITVARGVGQIAGAAIANGVILYKIANAFEQASVRPQSRLMQPVRVSNNTQIFRNAWSVSGSMAVIKSVVGENPTAESRMDCGLFHAADIEGALIFGQKSSSIVNGQLMTTMDGIVETTRRLAPAGNTTIAGATTNFTQLEAMLNPVFDTVTNGRNGNERVAYVGGAARTVINNIGRLSGQYQIVDGQTSFGLQFSTFKTSRGSFKMIEHPYLNSNPTWAKMLIALDVPSIRLMYLPGRKTKYTEYGIDGRQIINQNEDSVGGDLLTEITMEITNPSANAVIYNLTAAAAG